jgi:hypothetical protein
MSVQPTIMLNRGSDATFTGFWPSAPGSLAGMNLTGYVMDAVFVHEALQGHLTLTITDALDGRFFGRIEWQDNMPTGAIMSFIIRISLGGNNSTLPKIVVVVK